MSQLELFPLKELLPEDSPVYVHAEGLVHILRVFEDPDGWESGAPFVFTITAVTDGVTVTLKGMRYDGVEPRHARAIRAKLREMGFKVCKFDRARMRKGVCDWREIKFKL